MVVRRTEKREVGLATGWSEEDGTTTTYQPFARSVGSHRRIETGPVPRNVQQRTVARASLYARRPSGVQPKVATPALDDYEVLELDELDLSGNPFAPRRSAASVSVWNVLGFAALFASVLIGRVIVDAGQSRTRTVVPPPPSAAAATGSAGVGSDAQRNAAALDPDVAARDDSPAANAAAAAASATDAAAPSAGAAQPGSRNTSASSAKRDDNPSPPSTSASSVKPEPSPGSSTGHTSPVRSSQTRESNDSTDPATTHSRAPSNDWRDGPMEPATTNAQVKSNDWRDGPMEPATTNAQVKSNDARDGAMEPATNARAPSNDWRDGPMEPATTNARTPSADWRDNTTAAPALASKAAPGTLRINSRPWSQVFIDGRLIGNTPQMNLSVPAGRYTVRLSNPELGMGKTIVIQVAAGELVTRIETLE